MPTLFDTIQIGAIGAANRVVMAPLTRGRADRGSTPTKIMGDYYEQRSGAGLIITEATGISRLGLDMRLGPFSSSAFPTPDLFDERSRHGFGQFSEGPAAKAQPFCKRSGGQFPSRSALPRVPCSFRAK